MDPKDREDISQKKRNKIIKIILLGILIFLIFNFIIWFFFSKWKNSKNSSNTEYETGIISGSNNKENEDASEENSSDTSENEEEEGEEPDGYFEEDYVSTQVSDINETELGDDETTTVLMGTLMIDYPTDYIRYGTGTLSNFWMDIVYFTDGEDGNITGSVFAIGAFDGLTASDGGVETVDEAQEAVTEYFYSGGTATSEWEECENFFVRKVVGYSADDDAAIMNFLVFPKNGDADPYMYQAVYTMTPYAENSLYGVPTSEEVFDISQAALLELCPDSELLQITYIEMCEELIETLYYQTAKDSGSGLMDGIYTLKKNALSYAQSQIEESIAEYLYEQESEEDEIVESDDSTETTEESEESVSNEDEEESSEENEDSSEENDAENSSESDNNITITLD